MRASASSFVLIAETGERFADFGPYVAAINNAGLVAFRAQLAGGASGLFTGDGAALTALPLPYDEFIGHPDLNDAGAVSFIAQSPSGSQNLSVLKDGRIALLADTSGELAKLGPLGPMMNQAGQVVFCACTRAGEQRVQVAGPGQTGRIAGTGWRALHGLPVINNSGAVLFRADTPQGTQGIFLGAADSLTTIVDASGPYQELGNFPTLDDGGTAAFTATLKPGGSSLLLWCQGRIRSVLDSTGRFASFRSAIIDGAGEQIFTATPQDGKLGVYRRSDESAQRILGLGDPFQDSTVGDFALNAVSLNARGQFALRVRLANGRQLILRAEPSAP